jgi:hypothetical protein
MPGSSPSLSPQPRRRALARLEAEIAAQELVRARWLARARAEEAAGTDSRWARGMLSLAEQQLGRLNRSREVLRRGEAGEDEGGGDEDPA